MAITKEKLEILQPSFDDTCVIGINSGLPDYKLAWLINNKLPIHLERQDDIIKNGGNMPGKWQLMIYLGQQTILKMQQESVA